MNKKIWDNCLSTLKKKLSAPTFESWFEHTELVNINEETITLKTKNKMIADWIESNYIEILKQVIKQTLNLEHKIEFVYPEKKKQINNLKNISASSQINENNLDEKEISTILNDKYTFDNFVVGTSNDFAYATSMKVAKDHIKANYNPLFIYGPSGLGKTHLVQAIGNFIKKNHPEMKICYVTSETFMSKFIESIRENTKHYFSNYFRNTDLLMIDDIHFFSNKESTQVEFFHTFNALFNTEKQIVLTSDRPPIEIKDVEERLITRFQSGLVVDIQPPELEMRIAIIQKKAQLHNLILPDDVIMYLANNFKSNIRQLEGVVTKLAAYSSLTGHDISLDISKEVLVDLLPKKSKNYSVETIQKIVGNFYEISIKSLIDKSRKNDIAIPRMIAMYLCREFSNETLSNIGLKFGRRDHSTVFNAIEKITDKINQDNKIKNQVNQLIHLIEIS